MSGYKYENILIETSGESRDVWLLKSETFWWNLNSVVDLKTLQTVSMTGPWEWFYRHADIPLLIYSGQTICIQSNMTFSDIRNITFESWEQFVESVKRKRFSNL